MLLSPLDNEELECKIEKIEIKVEKNTDKINELEKNFAVTNQRLDSIEKSQSNIESVLMKNSESSLENFNNIKDIMTKNTDSILQMSNSFLNYLTKKDKNDNQMEVNLNKGWNKREIVIAVIGLIGILGTAAWGVAK